MTRIAFLGLGAMGSRMAARLLDAGHQLTVWNRSAERMQALSDKSARVCDTPQNAARDADIIVSMLRDDEASEQVWLDPDRGALGGMNKDAIGVECSTLSLPYMRRLSDSFERKERKLLDAPVAGSRPQAEAGQLIFLAGGPSETVETLRPIFNTMGGAVHHAGEIGAGMVVKLMVNALFGAQLAMIAELIGFAQRTGIDTVKAMNILGETPICSPAAKGASAAMLANAFAPAFPIELVAKDFQLIAHSSASVGAHTPLSELTRQIYEAGIAKGLGDDNITGIVQLYSQKLGGA